MIVSMMNLSKSDIFPITTNNITDYKKYIYMVCPYHYSVAKQRETGFSKINIGQHKRGPLF